MSTRRIACLITVVLLLVVATGACGSSSSQPQFNSESGREAEQSAEIAKLAWPPEAPMPSFARPPISQRETNYELGFGTTEADFAWFCSWSQEWLDTRTTNSKRATDALSKLDGIVHLEAWTTLDPDGQQPMLDAISRARLGDAGAMQSIRRSLSCQ